MKHLSRVLAIVLICGVVWVAGPTSQAATDKPMEKNRMQPDHAPTPYSADEIRQGCPRKRKIVFQVETFGQTVMFQSVIFLTVEQKEVVFEAVTTGSDGKQIGSRKMTTGLWTDLQSHASFPESQTEIRTETITTPAGTFDCWLYEVSDKKSGKTGVMRYWFAKNLPGPPVLYEEVADQKVIYKMSMLKTGME